MKRLERKPGTLILRLVVHANLERVERLVPQTAEAVADDGPLAPGSNAAVALQSLQNGGQLAFRIGVRPARRNFIAREQRLVHRYIGKRRHEIYHFFPFNRPVR